MKNKPLIMYLASLIEKRPGTVELEYVKAHNGEEGNEGADTLAVRGCFEPVMQERSEWVFKGWPGTSRLVEDDLGEFDVSVLPFLLR